MIVSPEMDAVPSTRNTRLFPPVFTVTPAVGPMIDAVPVVSVSSSARHTNDRLRRLDAVLSNVIVWAPQPIGWPIAQRSEPSAVASVLVTTTLDSSRRPGAASIVGCICRRFRARSSPTRSFADRSVCVENMVLSLP